MQTSETSCLGVEFIDPSNRTCLEEEVPLSELLSLSEGKAIVCPVSVRKSSHKLSEIHIEEAQMKRLVILFAVFTVVAVLCFESSAQTGHMDADPLYQGFLNPPRDFSPMPFWFW